MIVIIGNGIAGVTAARNVRKKSNVPITIVSAESKYFFSRTALMYVYMGHMKFEHTQPYEPHFWEENHIDLVQDYVERIDTEGRYLHLRSGQRLKYDQLVIASGSQPNKFGWKGQDAERVQGLYSKQDLESMERDTKGIQSAVIVGGGLIGVEMAEMLLSRNIEVDFLVRENGFWGNVLPPEDAQLIMEHMTKHHGLRMHYGVELDEILTDASNRAVGVLTKDGRKIDCQFVGLTAGVSPNIQFLKDSDIETNRGVLVNRRLETSAPHIYAIGDCAEFREPLPGRRPIEQVWYTGKFMGETLAHTLTGHPTDYNPGHWFNSAKFFDIEYQTYGDVSCTLPEGQSSFVYRHPTEEILLHFRFETESRKFVGINNFGVRLRHLVFNHWLDKGATIDEVLTNLKSANFDPEMYRTYEKHIINQFNVEFGTHLSTARKTRWWQHLIDA